MRIRPLFLALLPSLLLAEPTLQSSPAVALSFSTEKGSLHQLQVKNTDSEGRFLWRNVGPAILGNGDLWSTLQPGGEYRLHTPSKEWALVWSDEFDGDRIDFGKWEREENNYGGGNNERQAYRTDPKYSFVKDGSLNIAVYRDSHTTSDGKTQPYSSARLRTMNRGDWTFG